MSRRFNIILAKILGISTDKLCPFCGSKNIEISDGSRAMQDIFGAICIGSWAKCNDCQRHYIPDKELEHEN